MVDSQREARLELARKLRESADHSSEQELRDALSRSYYSLYHLARVLVGKEGRGGLDHDSLRKEVEYIDAKLAEILRHLYRLRENADYDPHMVIRNYRGDLDQFRLAVTAALEEGRNAYDRIVSQLNPHSSSNGASHGTK